LAAALAIFGAIDVPIIYYAVKIWKTMHPETGVVGKLPSSMWVAFWPCVIALLLCSLGLMAIRIRQIILAEGLDVAWIKLDRACEGATTNHPEGASA
jgi:heme exporter protein C